MSTKYERIARDIRRKMERGELKPGDWLPAEAQLATRYEVNRRTVRRALDVLEQEGRVDRQHGRGTIVKEVAMGDQGVNVLYVGRTSQDYYRELYWAISREAQARDMTLTCFSQEKPTGELQFNGHLQSLADSADGVICESKIWPRLVRHLPADVNVVQVTSFSGEDIEQVEERPTYVLATNQFRASRLATERLVRAGCERIALVCVGWGREIDDVRREVKADHPAYLGYKSMLQRLGREEEWVVGENPGRENDQQGGQEAIGRFLDATEAVPDGFVCQGDFRAAPLLRVLRKRGLEVPGDVSVVGMGNTPWCEMLDPPLTSISLGEEQIARMAVLLAREVAPEYQQVMRMSPKLVERDSAKAAEKGLDELREMRHKAENTTTDAQIHDEPTPYRVRK